MNSINPDTVKAVYMRSEWIDAATGAPLEEYLTAGDLFHIMYALRDYRENFYPPEIHPGFNCAYAKLESFTERHELGAD
jgi:hypothetical protein